VPFMTDGAGAEMIGGWFGTGVDRGIALVFILTGLIGLLATAVAMQPSLSATKRAVHRTEGAGLGRGSMILLARCPSKIRR
jgi:DHA3 family multidrug efflux protein-like MFS transporter